MSQVVLQLVNIDVNEYWGKVLAWCKTRAGKATIGLAGLLVARKIIDVLWRKARRYPPGPCGWLPFMQWMKLVTIDRPFLLGAAKDYGEVSMLWMGIYPIVLINGERAMNEVFNKHGLVARTPFVDESKKDFYARQEDRLKQGAPYDSLSFIDGERWRVRRKLMHTNLVSLCDSEHLNAIVSNYMEVTLFPAIDRVVDEALSWQPKQDMTRTTLNTMFRAGFGFDITPSLDEFDEFTTHMLVAVSLITVTTTTAALPTWLQLFLYKRHSKAIFHFGEMKRIIGKWMADYQADSAESNRAHAFYMDAMKQAVLDGILTEKEMMTDCSTIFLAGTQTTQTGLEQAIFRLVQFPALQDAIFKQLKHLFPDPKNINIKDCFSKIPLLKAFVLENLRLSETAEYTLARLTNEPMTVTGYQIPSGAVVLANLYGMCRNESLYEDAWSFNPGRWLNQDGSIDREMSSKMVSFGVGRRNCAGRSLAEKQTILVLAHLIRRYQFGNIEGTDEIVIPNSIHYWLKQKGSIFVTVQKRD